MRVTQGDGFDLVLSSAAEQGHLEHDPGDPRAQSVLDLTAFVSCYNEAPYILETIENARQALLTVGLAFEIIVVDDCSTDNSFDLIRAYIAKNPGDRIIVRRNHYNKGLAKNYTDVAFLGKGKYYKLFCGDNSEPRESTIKILRSLGDTDMVIVNYDTIEGKGGFRTCISKAYTLLVNLISGNRIRSYNGLSVHFRYNIMRWHSNTRGFGFQADLICKLIEQGATYKEISVPNIHRSGSGALSLKNLLSVGHTFLDLLIRRIANKYYRRPVAYRKALEQNC